MYCSGNQSDDCDSLAEQAGFSKFHRKQLRHYLRRFAGLVSEAQKGAKPVACVEEIERLRAECNEQARLLGISGSREAKLMADIEALRKELAEANSFIESLANACQAAEARAIELQSLLDATTRKARWTGQSSPSPVQP